MRSFLVMATAIMFLGSTLEILDNLILYTVQIQSLVNLKYDPLPTMIRWDIFMIIFTRISVKAFSLRYRYIGNSSFDQYFLGDLIVVWRAWLLFQKELVPRCILVFCIAQSFGELLEFSKAEQCWIEN
jgi:hypothetical protein